MTSTKHSLLEIQCQCGYLSVFVINRDGKPVGIMRKEGGKVVEYPIV